MDGLNVLVHIVNRLSTFVVSTFAMSLMLTESTGDANREGILRCEFEMLVWSDGGGYSWLASGKV